MKPSLLILAVIFFSGSLFAQYGKLSGTITDKSTNEPLTNVNVLIPEIGVFGTSDKNGEFVLEKVPYGRHIITFSHIGYRTEKISVDLESGVQSVSSVSLMKTSVTIGEVTVSSTKYRKIIRDVSLPVEVVTQENILKQTGTSVPDIIKNEPGLSTVSDGVWATDISIRGLSRQNVVTLVDGNRIETASNLAAGLSLIDLNDVDKIEIIKGGVSSLYGTGATGGVISITTKPAAYSERLSLSGSLTSGYNTVNKGSFGNLSLSVSGVNWYTKFSGSMRYAQNTKTPVGELPNSQFKDNSISASVGFRPVQDHELKFQYQKFSGSDIGLPGGKTFPNTATAKYSNISRELFNGEYAISNLSNSWNKTLIKYFAQKISRSVELKPNATTTSAPSADHLTAGGQIQTNWSLSDLNHLIAGIDIWQRTYSGIRETKVVTGNSTRITGDLPVPYSSYRSIGFFAQDGHSFFDNKLSLTLGGRIDQIHVKNDAAKNPSYIINNGVLNPNPPSNAQSSFAAGESDEISWSTNLSLLYNISRESDVTLNFARSFRAPVLEERFQYINLGGDIFLGNPGLKSEKGYFFDLGYRLWNQYVAFRTNIFLNSFNDLVVDAPVVTDSLYRKENIGKAQIYGFDIQAEYNFFDDMVFYTTASYVRGEDKTGNTNLPLIAPLNGRIGLRYKNLSFGYIDIDAHLFAKQDKIAKGEKETPGYGTLNLYLSSVPVYLHYANLRIFAGIENILDKEYRNHLSTNRGTIVIEPGRNIFFKINLTF
ncbi:MAG: TonB-dependent receptor [Ignavibacteriaceae bacterium]